ncbi:MAG: Npt1/Npt2 family nucleotide transporter [Halieaceae bacterium]
MTKNLMASFRVQRDELPLAILMFSYFFLVITSFWILKPIKKGLFIEYYDQHGFSFLGALYTAPQAELLAKMLNMVVAFVAVVVFTQLSRQFRRQQLTYLFSMFFIVCYLFFGQWLDAPGDVTVWSFYLFGDLFSTLMVATFFAFLNDSVTPDAAKRLYGLVGLGGVCGGVFGTSVVSANVGMMPYSGWLWVCIGVAVLIMIVAGAAGSRVLVSAQSAATDEVSDEPTGNAATEGARLVFSSYYLLSIVAIVGLYEIISTIVDFQFTSTVAHYLDGPDIGRHFATVFTITNWVSLFVQLFLTSFIMTRFGLGVALLILPAMIALGSSAFLFFPALWVGSMLSTADNGFSYSINQSSKEALYVPTSAAEKYRAKAFIDMFVQRFAKAIAVLISLGITFLFKDFESMRYLGLLTLVLIVVWIWAARYAGRKFAELEEGS